MQLQSFNGEDESTVTLEREIDYTSEKRKRAEQKAKGICGTAGLRAGRTSAKSLDVFLPEESHGCEQEP